MSQSVSNSAGKKLIKIDVSSDTVCPWCFVGKRNLDKAIALSKDQYEFEVWFSSFAYYVHFPYCSTVVHFPSKYCRLGGTHFFSTLLPQKKELTSKTFTGKSLDLDLNKF